jgi:hypothetical protein
LKTKNAKKTDQCKISEIDLSPDKEKYDRALKKTMQIMRQAFVLGRLSPRMENGTKKEKWAGGE